MLYSGDLSAKTELRQQIRDCYRQSEAVVVERLLGQDQLDAAARARIWQRARQLILHIRQEQEGKGGVDALLQEFSLSTEEGIVLMCLAEALLRVPDKDTMDRLIRDKLSAGDWDAHLGNSDSVFVNASAWGLLLTGKMVSYSDEKNNRQFGILKQTMGRVGEPVIRRAVRYAMQIMGTQFVLGTTIAQALKRAAENETEGYRYSYDMLGEGARTEADAQRYFQSYMDAIKAIGKAAAKAGPERSPGISVKLSAIHPRYEFSHRERAMSELVPRLKELALAAKHYDIGFTVDAEEADRLDLSFDVIEAVYLDQDLAGWEGFGLAVQAYQKRAYDVIDWVAQLARRGGRKIMVRLVKGAYWDSEIKWSQEEGLNDYPVFTRKASTDVSYQMCAQKLLAARDCIFPQFATHNAYTVATILEMDAERSGYEFQRLHGMGEALYETMLADENIACRIYAPVGEHADLLAYLVRRLLENGANSSFVNNIVDEDIPVESLLEDPCTEVRAWSEKTNSAIPLPKDIFQDEFGSGEAQSVTARANSRGLDLTDTNETESLKTALESLLGSWLEAASQQDSCDHRVINPADHSECIGGFDYHSSVDIEAALQASVTAQVEWAAQPVTERAALLNTMADALEDNQQEFIALCVKEAGKSLPDAVAEIREAVDFCRYYARQAQLLEQDHGVAPRGVVLCISPWNFPLAIFLGQVAAALVTGNTVLAKPAEQTSLVALRCVSLWQSLGLPAAVLQLILGPGKSIGEQLVPDARIAAVMFTGSTGTGQWINRSLAQRADNDIPLVAETGGQNAMIVDSTALPEQVVDDVMASGFQSAGQRCSALRVLFLQEDVADKVITMIKGAMAELEVGDPKFLGTDVGPVIDTAALQRLQAHKERLAGLANKQARLHYECALQDGLPQGNFFGPHLYELASLDLLHEEVFGPVVHIVRFKSNELDDVIGQINRAGFGLTLGVHSRIQSVCDHVARQAKVGNVYINRNIIGAVVGVQPFGGRGLSGTGPKAGGPAYLQALVKGVDNVVVESAPAAGDKPESEERKAQLTEVCLEHGPLSCAITADATRDAKWDKVLLPLVNAQAQWQQIPVDTRLGLLKRVLSQMAHQKNKLGSVASIAACQAGLDVTHAMMSQAKLLPGPTGESNVLCHDARGVLLFIANTHLAAEQYLAAIFQALAAGNGLLLVPEQLSDNTQALLQGLQALLAQEGVDAPLLMPITATQLPAALASPALAGVISHFHSQQLRLRLSEREGAILPVLDCMGEFYGQRLAVEKTITTDTTAAGGNASLMSISED